MVVVNAKNKVQCHVSQGYVFWESPVGDINTKQMRCVMGADGEGLGEGDGGLVGGW